MTDQTWEKFPNVFTPALKKRVSKEWAAYFTEFELAKPLLFGKRVGCLWYQMALGVTSSRETYTPAYDATNLSRDMDFMISTIEHQYQTERNTPGYVRLCFHDLYYRNVAARMREQAILPLEGPISLRDMMAAYQNYAEVNNRSWRSDSALDDPAMICAWAGRPDLVEECLTWGLDLIASFNEKSRARSPIDPDAWVAKIRLLTSDPERLRQITRDRVVLHKLTKIPYQDFSDAAYKEAP
jgi:hypothetical protein